MFLEFLRGEIECLVRNVVEIRLGKPGNLHAARLEVLPAQFLRRRDLRVDGVARFVANAGENHK